MKLFKSKKAQLGVIEFKFLLMGLVIGIVLTLILVYLANNNIIPFGMKFLCGAAAK